MAGNATLAGVSQVIQKQQILIKMKYLKACVQYSFYMYVLYM